MVGYFNRSAMKRSAIKRRPPKKRQGHDKAMLEACRGQPCYLKIEGVCVGGTDTTVPCHSNQAKHGKGMGIKADDKYTVPGCHACHAELDQGHLFSKEEKFSIWDSAFEVWEVDRKALIDSP